MNIEIELLCNNCLSYIEYSCCFGLNGNIIFDVKPCKKCLNEAYNEGHKDGLRRVNNER